MLSPSPPTATLGIPKEWSMRVFPLHQGPSCAHDQHPSYGLVLANSCPLPWPTSVEWNTRPLILPPEPWGCTKLKPQKKPKDPMVMSTQVPLSVAAEVAGPMEPVETIL